MSWLKEAIRGVKKLNSINHLQAKEVTVKLDVGCSCYRFGASAHCI